MAKNSPLADPPRNKNELSDKKFVFFIRQKIKVLLKRSNRFNRIKLCKSFLPSGKHQGAQSFLMFSFFMRRLFWYTP